ncbi:hypothetical protein ACWGJ9_09210 [Curtobacterium citreum]
MSGQQPSPYGDGSPAPTPTFAHRWTSSSVTLALLGVLLIVAAAALAVMCVLRVVLAKDGEGVDFSVLYLFPAMVLSATFGVLAVVSGRRRSLVPVSG